MNGVNPLLSDNSMGGSSTCVGWHGLVFAMQLRKQLNSQQELIQRLTDNQGTLVQNISGMKPLQTLIKVGVHPLLLGIIADYCILKFYRANQSVRATSSHSLILSPVTLVTFTN